MPTTPHKRIISRPTGNRQRRSRQRKHRGTPTTATPTTTAAQQLPTRQQRRLRAKPNRHQVRPQQPLRWSSPPPIQTRRNRPRTHPRRRSRSAIRAKATPRLPWCWAATRMAQPDRTRPTSHVTNSNSGARTAAPSTTTASGTAEALNTQTDVNPAKSNTAGLPNFGFSASAASTASNAATTASTSTSAAAAVPIAGLTVAIAARAQAGSNQFDIRLDPPELGRIDVRLDVGRDGQVTTHMTPTAPTRCNSYKVSSRSLSARSNKQP